MILIAWYISLYQYTGNASALWWILKVLILRLICATLAFTQFAGGSKEGVPPHYHMRSYS